MTPRVPPERVPTLTEVVELFEVDHEPAAAEADAECADRLLAQLQRRIEATLHDRLDEALAPVLARLAATAAREARPALVEALRELTLEAIAEEARGRR